MIGDFFNWWLLQGKVPNQIQIPGTTQPAISNTPIRSNAWITSWITASNAQWVGPDGRQTSFIKLLLNEMASEAHLDRMAIYQARPNMKKGAVRFRHPFAESSQWRNERECVQQCSC